MVRLKNLKEEVDWKLIGVFSNAVRVEIIKMLLEFEFRSLSEIAKTLEKRGWKMSLSGVLKHMKELEKAGLIRHDPGIFAEKPDARKTMYSLEGRERIEKILQKLEGDVVVALKAGMIFSEAANLIRRIQRMKRKLTTKERKSLESLLVKCESENVYKYLTEDERKKLKLWRMMLSII